MATLAELTVSSFIANFKKGGARPNRYKVYLTFPNTIDNGNTASKLLSFTCKSASIPASSIGVCEAPYMGRKVKFVGDKEIEDWNVTVINDTDFLVRNAFVRWHEKIMGMATNVATPGWENTAAYFGEARVEQLDREGNVLKSYIVKSMFPTTVDAIELGYDNNDSLEEFQVTFAVNEWIDESITLNAQG